MYYLGVDSGGTKTAFTVIDEKGNKVLQFERGTGHYMQIGFEGVRSLYLEALNYIYKNLGIKKEELNSTFMGIPGYGEVEKDKIKLEEILGEVFKEMKYKVGNDVESGWAGGLACEPGINVVCGTGSIAVGVNKEEKIARSGGWGEFIGDEASAYWIAKKAIELFSKQSDYRLERTVYYEEFKAQLALKYDFELIDLLHGEYKLNRTKVAKISLIVSKIAHMGDQGAIDIFKKAAKNVYLMINSIRKQLNLEDNIKVSYTGGVFKSGELILGPLKEEISKNNLSIEIIEPILSPVAGSALLAYKLDGNKITEEIINNLKH